MTTRRACVLLAAALAACRPSGERDWDPLHAEPPRVEFRGDTVLVRGLRDWVHGPGGAAAPRLIDRELDLRAVRSVDYAVELFDWWRGPAHVLLSFGFEDGPPVAVSVEARREAGEPYGALRGLLRAYELIYVVGTERDLVGLRTHVRGNPVYLYPTSASPAQARALLESMLRRAEALAAAPEFYHTLANSCAVNIARHLRELSPGSVPRSLRLVLPGYSDRLAYDLGWLDRAVPLGELRLRHRIDRKARGCALDERFSACIRSP